MLNVKVSDIHYQMPASSHIEWVSINNTWAIEKLEAPFEFIAIHSDCVKLNEVSSVDGVAEAFLKGGGSIVREKLTIKGVASLISCKDTRGHIFSFIEQELA
ncbi:MAG: hypothetical protein Q9M31_06725, partial [Mariprofundus sp.]|nr:hypothetical protein [Mariprofundus sp.]